MEKIMMRKIAFRRVSQDGKQEEGVQRGREEEMESRVNEEMNQILSAGNRYGGKKKNNTAKTSEISRPRHPFSLRCVEVID